MSLRAFRTTTVSFSFPFRLFSGRVKQTSNETKSLTHSHIASEITSKALGKDMGRMVNGDVSGRTSDCVGGWIGR